MKLEVIKSDGKVYVNAGAFIFACEVAYDILLGIHQSGVKIPIDLKLHKQSLDNFKAYVRREER